MKDRAALYVVAAAAPPVRQLAEACHLAIDAGWQPFVTLTPTAAEWIDAEELTRATGQPVRVQPRQPGDSDPFPPADALLAAPLTFNTINKWASGISDTVALGLLNELVSGELPIVAVPCVKAALRAHPAYAANIQLLTRMGVHFVDPDLLSSRDPDGLVVFDWASVLREMTRCTRAT